MTISGTEPLTGSWTAIAPTPLGDGYVYTMQLPASSDVNQTSQWELGPTFNTESDQVFQNGATGKEMITENRFPYTSSAPVPSSPSSGDFSKPVLSTIPNGSVITYGTPVLAQPGQYYFPSLTFSDPNIPLSWVSRNGLIHIVPGRAEGNDSLQGIPDPSHISSLIYGQKFAGQWWGETCRMSVTNLNAGNPMLPVVPEVTYWPASSTGWTSTLTQLETSFAPRPGDQFYLFAPSTITTINMKPVAVPMSADSAFSTTGTTPSNLITNLGPKWVIDYSDDPAASPTSGTDLFLHIWSEQVPQNVEVKTNDVAFDLDGKSNVIVNRINLFAATVYTNLSSSNDLIENVAATYLSGYDRTGKPCLNAPYPPPTVGSTTNGYFGELYSGIELLGSNDRLINSEVAYCAANGVTVSDAFDQVTNCYIHDVDSMATDNSGVYVVTIGALPANAIHDFVGQCRVDYQRS